MRKLQKYKANIQIDGREMPVDVVVEKRANTRFGITGKRMILRVPTGVTSDFIHTQLAAMQSWAQKVFSQKPALKAAFSPKEFKNGDVITVGVRQYILELSEAERNTHTARLVGNTIQMQLSNKSTDEYRLKAIKTLLSRVVANDFQPEITKRVLDMNERTFKQAIQSVHLKYNHSNWGSCSRGRNINLSTRLLFAPEGVQDYVILHELAHLVEMNHSDRFWALVERHMPDYQDKERWLKQNRDKCDF
jgi:predicted metal-dependent hydrolase